MPCNGGGSYDGEYHQKINSLTQMLCMQLRALERTGNADLIHDAVQVWWEQHKLVDAQRLANEKLERANRKLAAKAKKKLTREERRALGLE
jgi:hypothetical protein